MRSGFKFLTKMRFCVVRLDSLSKSFGFKTVIRDLSLTVQTGERFVLLGRSGCGKTTLLRLIAGFETPDQGTIHIGGEDMEPFSVEKRPVGFIFQSYALFPHMSVYDNIAVGPRIRGLSEDLLAKRIDKLLNITHLEGLKHAMPARLSGGEAQRVAIIRAIVNRPKILLLDEPLSALDATLRTSLREELKEIQETLGITFLFVTHDQEEAMNLATRIGILEKGRLLQVGEPEALYNHPNSPFVAGFLGTINQFGGTVKYQGPDKTVVSLGKKLTLRCHSDRKFLEGRQVDCFIRPERIFFSGKDRIPEPVNQLDAVIQEKIFYGNQTQFKVEIAGGHKLLVSGGNTPEGTRPVNLKVEKRVPLFVSGRDILLFESTPAPEPALDAFPIQ